MDCAARVYERSGKIREKYFQLAYEMTALTVLVSERASSGQVLRVQGQSRQIRPASAPPLNSRYTDAMSLLHRLAMRVGWELARNPETRAKAAQTLAKTRQVLQDDVKPMAQRAWRNAQPEIEHAKRRLKGFAQELRDEYRKGREGE